MEAAAAEEGVEVAEALGKAGEAQPPPDANPWLSLPQSREQRREGEAEFHERQEIP